MDKLTELIFLYLDGEATPAEQQELFAALSESDELQRQFHQALQMQRALDTERARAAAPAEVKEAVYAALGISVPNKSLVRRLLPYASTSATIAGIAIGIALLFPHRPNQPARTIEPAKPIETRVALTRPSLPARSDAMPTRQSIESFVHAPRTDAAAAMEQSAEADDLPPFTFERKPHPVSAAEPLAFRFASTRMGMVFGPMLTARSTEAAPWIAQLSYRSSMLAGTAPSSLENFSLVAFYRFDDNNRLGIEFRRAPYTLNIAQPQSTLTTATLSSVAIAYSFTEPDLRILGGVPFVQPSVGLSRLGPVVAISAGLHFPVTREFNLSVGFDGSALVYSSQVASTLSVLLGINVGLPIR